MIRERTRIFDCELFNVSETLYGGSSTTQHVFFVNRETTTDEEHPWYAYRRLVRENARARRITTGVEVGGEFTSLKTKSELLTPDIVKLKASPYKDGYLYNFAGPLIPRYPGTSNIQQDVRDRYPLLSSTNVSGFDTGSTWSPDMWPPVQNTDEELETLGAAVLPDLAPTAPHNSVYTSLGELKNDGIPSLPFLSFAFRDGKMILEKVGGEFLNYQFGVAPTISDVKSILNTVSQADKLWKQYLRDSGRLVRRRMVMDPVTTTTTSLYKEASTLNAPIGTSTRYWSSVGPIVLTETITTKRWVSAAFLYYVAEESLSGLDGWLERANYLYGWKPSPSAVYNLTAWSWLLDWFTNAGDVYDNISLYLEDPFLTKWAYVMEHQTVTRTFTQELVSTPLNGSRSFTASVSFTIDSKKRRKVNPFHFGLEIGALNGRQLAILAALGLTKGANPGSM